MFRSRRAAGFRGDVRSLWLNAPNEAGTQAALGEAVRRALLSPDNSWSAIAQPLPRTRNERWSFEQRGSRAGTLPGLRSVFPRMISSARMVCGLRRCRRFVTGPKPTDSSNACTTAPPRRRRASRRLMCGRSGQMPRQSADGSDVPCFTAPPTAWCGMQRQHSHRPHIDKACQNYSEGGFRLVTECTGASGCDVTLVQMLRRKELKPLLPLGTPQPCSRRGRLGNGPSRASTLRLTNHRSPPERRVRDRQPPQWQHGLHR